MRACAPYNFRSTLPSSMSPSTPIADPSVPADGGGPATFDLARTRSLVEPLYQDRTLRTGEPFLAHAEGIAAIVAPLRPDPDLLAAAFLFGVYDVLREPDEWLRSRFGATVAQLVADLRQCSRRPLPHPRRFATSRCRRPRPRSSISRYWCAMI